MLETKEAKAIKFTERLKKIKARHPLRQKHILTVAQGYGLFSHLFHSDLDNPLTLTKALLENPDIPFWIIEDLLRDPYRRGVKQLDIQTCFSQRFENSRENKQQQLTTALELLFYILTNHIEEPYARMQDFCQTLSESISAIMPFDNFYKYYNAAFCLIQKLNELFGGIKDKDIEKPFLAILADFILEKALSVCRKSTLKINSAIFAYASDEAIYNYILKSDHFSPDQYEDIAEIEVKQKLKILFDRAAQEKKLTLETRAEKQAKFTSVLQRRFRWEKQKKQTKEQVNVDIEKRSTENLKILKNRLQNHSKFLPPTRADLITKQKTSPTDLLTPLEKKLFKKLIRRDFIVQHGTSYISQIEEAQALTSVLQRKRLSPKTSPVTHTPNNTGNNDTVFFAYKTGDEPCVPPANEDNDLIEINLSKLFERSPSETSYWWSSETFYCYENKNEITIKVNSSISMRIIYSNPGRKILYQKNGKTFHEEIILRGDEVCRGGNIVTFRALRIIEQLRIIGGEYREDILNKYWDDAKVDEMVKTLAPVRIFEIHKTAQQRIDIPEAEIIRSTKKDEKRPIEITEAQSWKFFIKCSDRFLCAAYKAARDNKKTEFDQLLEKHKFFLTRKDPNRLNIVFAVAASGNTDFMQYLLEKKLTQEQVAELINLRLKPHRISASEKWLGLTPLEIAVYTNNAPMVLLLLLNGAPLTQRNEKNLSWLAKKQGGSELVVSFLEKGIVKTLDEISRSPSFTDEKTKNDIAAILMKHYDNIPDYLLLHFLQNTLQKKDLSQINQSTCPEKTKTELSNRIKSLTNNAIKETMVFLAKEKKLTQYFLGELINTSGLTFENKRAIAFFYVRAIIDTETDINALVKLQNDLLTDIIYKKYISDCRGFFNFNLWRNNEVSTSASLLLKAIKNRINILTLENSNSKNNKFRDTEVKKLLNTSRSCWRLSLFKTKSLSIYETRNTEKLNQEINSLNKKINKKYGVCDLR